MKINTSEIFKKIKSEHPLVHCITNVVSMNDCANALLAVDAHPIMTDYHKESKDITLQSKVIYINIGTLNKDLIKSTIKSLNCAKENKIPIVLDPVGINVSKCRKKFIKKIIKKYKPTVIKGNLTEIKSLVYDQIIGDGIEASKYYEIESSNVKLIARFCRLLSSKLESIICVTGKIDIISDHKKTYAICGGHKIMQKVSGSGCILGALLAAAIASGCDNLESCVTMTNLYGLCGQKALNNNLDCGNASFRNFLIDEIYRIQAFELDFGTFYEVI
ncbi:MAG: hydroxyethylthiazole kinase [Mycoplasma sp.]